MNTSESEGTKPGAGYAYVSTEQTNIRSPAGAPPILLASRPPQDGPESLQTCHKWLMQAKIRDLEAAVQNVDQRDS